MDERVQSRFENAWRERFRHYAGTRHDDAGIAGWSTSGLDARVRRFASLFKAPQPSSGWLDAGCGAGTYSRLLAEQGIRAIGLDYVPLTAQKARARDASGNSYVVGDLCQLPFSPKTFDGVICFGVTQALSSSVPAIKELARVTAPGGEIWIDALNRGCIVHAWGALKRRAKGKPMHLRYEYPGGLRQLMREQGLQEVKVHWLPVFPSHWGTVQRLVETPLVRSVLRWVPVIGMLLSHAFIIRAKKPPA